MAVYTKINIEEITAHLANYNIGKLLDFKEIIEGIDNSNFILFTSQGKYIFTIFESRIDQNILPYFVEFKQHLHSHKIPCPKPIKTLKGDNIINFKNKKSIIVSFLEGYSLKPENDGYYYNITENNCYQVGEILAKMHEASITYKGFRNNDLGAKGLENLYHKFKNFLFNYDNQIIYLIENKLQDIKNSWNDDLPNSSCHLDLFPDNVFFIDNKISAVIDFYFSAQDLLIYDFAITVNAWCFDKNNFNNDKFNAMLNGYQNIRKFSIAELNFLQNALICASMRFLMTRLHDYFFTPKNSLVKVKNPLEYKEKLVFFTNNKIL